MPEDRNLVGPIVTDRGAISGYDISPYGQRYLRIQPPPEEPATINVVINWFEELKKLAPAAQK